MTTYHFSSDEMLNYGLDEVQPWDLTADQFVAIQERCSGNAIPPTWAGAQQWAKDRSEELHAEATEYANSPNCGYYSLPMGYCKYFVSDDSIAYKTTSGTQFWIFREGAEDGGETFHVTLPLDRVHGNHHKTILLAIAGVSDADRDRWEKTYLLPGDTSPDVFEALWNEQKDAYDRVLVPHGFPPMETYAEAEARWEESRERNRKWLEGRQGRLAEGYEETEYEDYEDDE